MREVLLSAGDLIVALSAIPTLTLLIHYGFVRPFKLSSRGRRYQPWFATRTGRMIFSLLLALFLIQLNVVLSLFLGPDYLFREWVRVVGYSIALVAVCQLAWNYASPRPVGPAEPAARADH